MKKSFKFTVDCANCAAKIERESAKLPGVEKIIVNYMGQKLILTADDERYEEILDQVEKIAKKVEPDSELVRK